MLPEDEDLRQLFIAQQHADAQRCPAPPPRNRAWSVAPLRHPGPWLAAGLAAATLLLVILPTRQSSPPIDELSMIQAVCADLAHRHAGAAFDPQRPLPSDQWRLAP